MTVKSPTDETHVRIEPRRVPGAVLALMLLAAAACGSNGEDAADASESTTTAAPTTEQPDTTSAPTTTPPTTSGRESDEPTATSSPEDVQLLDFEFRPVPAGTYRVETIGAPFTIDVPEGWFVQPNSFGHFVLTDPDSMGPGDRDIVMIRPSNLADPDQPGAPIEDQAGDWPLDDIDGWLDALAPGVVTGEAVDTTLGGLDAVQFDVEITDEFQCGDLFCAGFATNREVNSLWFDRSNTYRVWWIADGDEAPIAVDIGSGADPDFIERAEAVLDTVTFETVGPNPIPSDGNLWELGIPSEVPAGEVSLPVGPGVTFEISMSHFVGQRESFANVFLDGPGEVDIFFPEQTFDGEPLETVDDVVAALESDPQVTSAVVGSRQVSGYEATELDITGPAPGPDRPTPSLVGADQPDDGWIAPPEGRMWVMETPDGLAVITAEWFEPDAMEPALALAAEILDSIAIGA